MKVRALTECFTGARRRKGAVFGYDLKPGEKLPAYLEEVAETTPVVAAEVVAPVVVEPVALSELNKTTASADALVVDGTDGPDTLSGLNAQLQDPDQSFLN